MPARSWFDRLPPELQEEVDAEWLSRRHEGVRAFAEWLATKGVEVHYSSVARQGKRFDQKLEQLRFNVRVARAFVKDDPDAAGDLAAASLQACHSALWDVQMALETDDPDRAAAALSKIARANADLARTGISLRRERERVRAEVAAEAETIAKRKGVTADTAAAIREALTTV